MKTPKYETILLERSHSLVRLSLNRPEAHNAMNQQMIGELLNYFTGIRDDRSIRVVVITGKGRTFCAGGDIKEMRAAGSLTPSERLDQARLLDQMLAAIDRAPQVVIASVHGGAFGGGIGLISVVDIAIATDSTLIGLPEVHLGIVPSVISPYVVNRIGLARARQLMLTGARVSGAAAVATGLVTVTYSVDSIADAVNELVNQILRASPAALAACKQLLFAIHSRPAAETIDLRVDLLSKLQASADGQEGLSAFIQKRRPNWVETIGDEKQNPSHEK